jgi:asparagine synthase (glutamine-hydrolysing)
LTSYYSDRLLDLPALRKLAETLPKGGWHKPEVFYAYQLKLGRGVAVGRFVRRLDGRND